MDFCVLGTQDSMLFITHESMMTCLSYWIPDSMKWILFYIYGGECPWKLQTKDSTWNLALVPHKSPNPHLHTDIHLIGGSWLSQVVRHHIDWDGVGKEATWSYYGRN